MRRSHRRTVHDYMKEKDQNCCESSPTTQPINVPVLATPRRHRHSFRGAGRKGSSSNTGSASASVDGSENLTSTSTPVCRGKSKFGSAEDGASRDGASSTYRDGRCKSGSRGGCSGSGQSSGVSFVLKNKRNAARVSRRRLTDEQVCKKDDLDCSHALSLAFSAAGWLYKGRFENQI